MSPMRIVAVCMCLLSMTTGQSRMSAKLCPTPLMRCMVPPCHGAVCSAFLGAECRSSYCGSCSAEFFVGDTEVTNLCDQVIPTNRRELAQPCAMMRCSVAPCEMAVCAAFPGAVCRDNYCEVCEAQFFVNETDVTNLCNGVTADSRLCVGCQNVADPCSVTSCKVFPDAQCRVDSCDCRASYWVGSRDVTALCTPDIVVVTDLASSARGPVSLDRKPHQVMEVRPPPTTPTSPTTPTTPTTPTRGSCSSFCLFQPCMVSRCPAHPTADCRNDNCNGCMARFYEGASEVTSQCHNFPMWGGRNRLFSWLRKRQPIVIAQHPPLLQHRRVYSPWSWLFGDLF